MKSTCSHGRDFKENGLGGGDPCGGQVKIKMTLKSIQITGNLKVFCYHGIGHEVIDDS